MRAYLIDTENPTNTGIIDLFGDNETDKGQSPLPTYYELLKCRCIDIVTRKIGDKWLDIICNDEGLYTNHPRVSVLDLKGRSMIYGNVIITNSTKDGYQRTLSDEDVQQIEGNLVWIVDEDILRPVLWRVRYD